MGEQTGAIIVFVGIGVLALVMFALERRGVAKRKAARGGREVDLTAVFDPTRENGQPVKQPGD